MSEEIENDVLAHLPRRWQNRWRRFSKRTRTVYKVGGAVAAGITALSTAYAFLSPSLEISPVLVGSETSVLLVEFAIKNTGHLSLVSNSMVCEIFAKNGHFIFSNNYVLTPTRQMGQFIYELAPGVTATRNCSAAPLTPEPVFPATIVITVNSKWPKYPTIVPWTTKAKFISLRDSTGHIQIKADWP